MLRRPLTRQPLRLLGILWLNKKACGLRLNSGLSRPRGPTGLLGIGFSSFPDLLGTGICICDVMFLKELFPPVVSQYNEIRLNLLPSLHASVVV